MRLAVKRRDELNRLVDQFEKNGGVVTKLPFKKPRKSKKKSEDTVKELVDS
jgi:hypothetical protein